eukprot:7010710-Pyramimonas_sp.AAC.1
MRLSGRHPQSVDQFEGTQHRSKRPHKIRKNAGTPNDYISIHMVTHRAPPAQPQTIPRRVALMRHAQRH